MPVSPPASHPFCLLLPPDMKPPKNTETKETTVMIMFKEDSSTEVKRRIREKIVLLRTANKKMVKIPYNTALARLLDPSIFHPPMISFP